MYFRLFIAAIITTISFQQSYAQRNYDGYNRIGGQLAVTLSDIITDDFVTEQGNGFQGGFTTRGEFRNNFDLIYGINFVSTNVGILARNGTEEVFVDYGTQGAQIMLLGSYNIVKHHLSLEFGPMLNVNGKLKLKSDSQEGYTIVGYDTLKAEDIQNIGNIHFWAAGGITAGIENIRLTALYQYGVTNVLNGLNDEDLEKDDFKGNTSTISLGLVLYL